MMLVPEGGEQDPVRPATTTALPSFEQQAVDVARQMAGQQPQEPQGAAETPVYSWARQKTAEMVRDNARRAENDFLTVLGVASETDPSRFGEARDIAKGLGIDPETALENHEVLRAVWKKRQAENADLARTSPALARELMSLEFARLAHDDVENLGFFEGLWSSFWAGRAEAKLGTLGEERMRRGDTKDLLDRSRNIRRDLRHGPKETGFFWGLSRFAGQQSEMIPEAVTYGAAAGTATGLVATAAGPGAPVTVPLATLAGFTSGFTASMLQQTYRLEAGLAYDDFIEAGYDQAISRSAAAGAGMVNTGLESVGLLTQFGRPLIAPLKKLLRKEVSEAFVSQTRKHVGFTVGKSYLLGVAAEGGTESIQDLVTMFAEDYAAKASKGGDPSSFAKGEVWDRMVDAGVAGAQVAAMLGTIPEYGRYRHLMSQSERAQQTKQVLTEAAKSMGESKLMKRAPDEATRFMAAALAENKSETVYIDGKVLGRLLQSADNEGVEAGRLEKSAADQLEEKVPGIKSQLEAGGDVAIPTVEFLKMADSDIGKKLIDHARVNPEHDSFAEVEQAKEDAPALLEKAGKTIEEREVFDKAGDEIETRLVNEVVATGAPVSKEQAQAFATLARNVSDNLAQEQGKLPSELKPLTVGKETPGQSGGLNQFAGESAKGAPRSAFRKATEMLRSGSTKEQIFTETGISVGADGALRFEISDHDASIKGDVKAGLTTLGELLHHPRLFKAYPQLHSLKVFVDGDSSPGVEGKRVVGSYSKSQRMWIADRKPLGSISLAIMPGPRMLSNLLHEIQHAIQDAEGFHGSLSASSDATTFDSYRKAPEEIEARNTQARQALTPDDRRRTPPEATEDIKSIAVVADSNILNQPSRGSYDIANNKITLNERTDASTLMHELAHAAWNMMLAIAEPSPALQANIDAMFKWFGITREQWDAMGVEKQEKYQERLAASFEKFLEEGKAPTVELQSVFERIAKWIRDAYKNIVGKINENHRALYGEDLPALTDEVRRVFGSMIAAEDAIANAEVVRGRMAAFQTREEFPGTDADWLEYQALVAARREGGISKLTASMQGHIRWLKRSREELEKAENKDVLAARKAAEAEAKDEVEQRGVYMLRDWIKTAKAEGEPTHRLRVSDIQDIFGNESQDILEALKGQVSEEGWPVDFLAQEFGFVGGGESMVRALIGEPELADAIANRVDEIVMRDHGSLRTEHDQVAAIEAALNTEAASRLAYETLRLVQGVKTPDRKMKLAVKEMARLKLRGMAVREVKPARFLMAATRAERAASEAFKGKRPSKAKDGSERPARDPSPMEGVRFLEQSLLNTEMAKQAAEAQKDIEKAKRLFAKFFGSDKDIGKHRNLDIVNAGRAILASFSLYGGSKLPLEFLAGLEKYSPELFARLNEKLVRATNGNTIQNYQDMPFGEFADLADTVKMLWQESQRTKQIEVDGKTTSRDAVVAEMIAVAVEVVGLGDTSSGPVPADARKKTWMADIVAHVRRVESWALKMDGNKPSGIWTRALFRPMRTRFDLYMSDRGRLVGKMETLLRGVNLSERMIDAQEDLGHTFTDMNQLLGALLHIGSQSSLRKLLLGYGWGSETKMGDQVALDTSRWDSFISKAIERGTLTKEHFDMIQAIWNINAELKPIAQKVNHEIAGVYFTEVEARPFTNKFGTFAGGYAPAPPDLNHKKNKHIAERVEGDILAEMERNFVESMPAVNKSFTIERNNSANPLVLDLRMQSKHFDQVLRFVHLQPAVRDALSLLQDEKLSTYLNQVDPSAIRQMLMPWLKDAAANQMVKRTRFTAMDGFFSFVRRAVGLRIMFGSISNALQQLTGISNVLAYVKAKHVGAAYWKVRELGGHVKALDYVKSQSVDMAVRLDSNLATSSDEIELLLNPSKWGRLQAMAGKHGYFMQRYMQNRVDVIAWIAAQSQSIAAGKSPEAAALEADSVVRLSQGSHAVVDVAAYERSSAFGRLFTQFSGYYNTVLNQIITAPEDQKTKVVAMALVMPAFAAASIAAALGLGSEFDDDDDTGLGGEIAWWMFKTPAKAVLSLVPGFGQLAAQRIAGEGSAGDRISLAPFASAIDSLSRAIQATFDTVQYALGNDEMEERVKNSKSGAVSGAGIRDFANAVSDVSGIPVALLGKAFGYLEDVADEKMPAPSGVLEAMSGITGNLRMPKR